MPAYIGYIVVACHNNTVFKIYKAAFWYSIFNKRFSIKVSSQLIMTKSLGHAWGHDNAWEVIEYSVYIYKKYIFSWTYFVKKRCWLFPYYS